MAVNELRSISVFVKAAELGSLRKAAAALEISPQAARQTTKRLVGNVECVLNSKELRAAQARGGRP